MNARIQTLPLLFAVWLAAVLPARAAEPIPLRAGQLQMTFEPDHGLLRAIRAGGHPVLQGINAPVRDQYWGTVLPEVQNISLLQGDDSFRLTFDAICQRGEIDFVWHGEIQGSARGELTFTFDGEAKSTFLRNRIGFCVLHGPEVAGKICIVETVGGERIEGYFPKWISPHQPFKEIRSIRHPVADQVWATVRMEGDTFEMEDQRNWTDASFKTYCTPLELPFPVEVAAGSKISHKVTVTVEGLDRLPAQDTATTRTIVRLSSDRPPQPLPEFGLQVSSQHDVLTPDEVRRLKTLGLGHLRVTITPGTEQASDHLAAAAEQAAQLGVDLHVGLQLSEADLDDLSELGMVVEQIEPPVAWLLLAATDQDVEVVRELLGSWNQSGKIGRGEDTNFTELNRSRPDPQLLDLASYGINPQVHAFDNTSLVETLPIQGVTVDTARRFLGSVPLLIAPITLRKQVVSEPPPPGELPSNVDPRQLSPFAAAWTVGSIKVLAETGIEAATYYETVGWLGVMESKTGSALPERFPSKPEQIYPVAHVFRALAPFAHGEVQPTNSSQPQTVVGLGVTKGARRRLLLANLTEEPQEVQLNGVDYPLTLYPLEDVATNPGHRREKRLDANRQMRLTIGPHQVLVADRTE